MPTSRQAAAVLRVPLLFALGCLLAGSYGILHDQVSYTVSPEYYTHLKFAQFGIPEHLHNRLGAALVGWSATWWMGLVCGLFIVPAGLVLESRRSVIDRTMRAYGVVVLTALVLGLGMLAVSFFTIREGVTTHWYLPPGLTDPVNFARVASMHNASYLGGAVGCGLGVVYLIAQWRRGRAATAAESPPAAVEPPAPDSAVPPPDPQS